MLPRWTLCLLPLFLMTVQPAGASEGANPYAIGDFYSGDYLPSNKGAVHSIILDDSSIPISPYRAAPTVRFGFTAHRDLEDATMDGVSHSVSSGCYTLPRLLLPRSFGGSRPLSRRFDSPYGTSLNGGDDARPFYTYTGDFGPYPKDLRKANPFYRDPSGSRGEVFRSPEPALP